MGRQRRSAIVTGLLAASMWSSSRSASGARGIFAGDGLAPMGHIHGAAWHWTRHALRPEAPSHSMPVRSPDVRSEGRPAPSLKCVRAGEKMRLHMYGDTAVMTIEGIALAPGGSGDHIPARVLLTGAQVQITVLGAGEGALEIRSEVWR